MSTESPWSFSSPTAPHPPTLPPPQAVTQDELRRLQTGLRQRRETERLRKSILERLGAGAGIECGPLTAEVEEKRMRQITRTVLERLWGSEYVENLRQHLPYTVQRHLKVTNQSSLTEL